MSNMGKTVELSSEELQVQNKLNQQLEDGMHNKDIELVMSCFWDSPDFIFVATDGTVVIGSNNFRQTVEQMFEQFNTINSVTDEVKYVRSGDSLLVVGTATYTMETEDGTVHTLKERWTDVRQKIGGKWVLVLNHTHALAPTE